ncbi:hypothetical protein RhiirA4_462436 [Rhizophagus irregularis]|uniref:MULE transposase domain-containing protein n=1 Tax=Rhizophagus irregularis TaxID=588596 RepID=A0A2I1GKZ3_9GLOM|nr:hypothetical protein RhiirA4_462436 [Rhizophagus irregularis]
MGDIDESYDNTCKTNHYNHPLSLFVTPDNNLKTRIIAQAIVNDETQLSYEWVYQCVKEATGISPRVLVERFTTKLFTIKRLFNEGLRMQSSIMGTNSNLSLCELFDALEERYQEENDYCEFVNWKQTVPQIGFQNIPKSIFGPGGLTILQSAVNEFLMPNIIKKQEEQMCYHATEIEFENVLSKENVLNKSNRCIDNLFDLS